MAPFITKILNAHIRVLLYYGDTDMVIHNFYYFKNKTKNNKLTLGMQLYAWPTIFCTSWS